MEAIMVSPVLLSLQEGLDMFPSCFTKVAVLYDRPLPRFFLFSADLNKDQRY